MSKPIFWNQACEDLSKKDKVMKLIIKKYNKDYLIESKNPFKTLCRSIISQQISTTAAKSIYERFESISSLIPQKIIKISDYNICYNIYIYICYNIYYNIYIYFFLF